MTHQDSSRTQPLDMKRETEVQRRPIHLNSKPSLLTDNSHYNLKRRKNRGDERKDD